MREEARERSFSDISVKVCEKVERTGERERGREGERGERGRVKG